MADFKNEKKVDVNVGFGDFNTIAAFVAAAVADGVSPTNRWTGLLGRGTWVENVSLPAGAMLIGMGPRHSVIDGYIDMESGSTIQRLWVRLLTAPAGIDYVVRVNHTVAGRSTYIIGCDLVVSTSASTGSMCILKIGGANSNGSSYVNVMGGYHYANNFRTGANPGNIRNIHYWMEAGQNTYVESFGVHHKSSTSSTGTSIPTLIYNETVTPAAGGFGYVHVVGDYLDAYGGNGVVPPAVFLKSLHTTLPGGKIFCPFVSHTPGAPFPAVEMTYTGTLPALYGSEVDRVRVFTGVDQMYNNTAFGYYPNVYADRAPTLSDLLPPGAEWQDTSTTLYESGNPPSSFRAYVTSVIGVSTGSIQVVVFGTEEEDTRTEYNPATGVFTAGTAGTYRFEAVLYWSDANAGQRLAYFYKNGAEARRFSLAKTASISDSSVLNAQIKLNAGDTVDVRAQVTTAGTIANSTSLSWFAGTKLF